MIPIDIQALKDAIVENGLIPVVLERCGCHHITDRGRYFSAANPDGDNPSAVLVYKDSLMALDFTRNIPTAHRRTPDLFDLATFFLQVDFFQALRLVCQFCGIDPYHDFTGDLPESIQITKMLMNMMKGEGQTQEDQESVKPIPEKILSYYEPCVAQIFLDDGISAEVQEEMQIGYDAYSNRITIPIRHEYGTLVGDKGRRIGTSVPDGVAKYCYLEPCAKGRVLYGLYRALPYIRRNTKCYVVESEKAVMQGMSLGIDNMVATGGKTVSSQQIEMLSRLCVDIVLCFDKDVERAELQSIANRFIGRLNVSALIDTKGILADKESPTDREENFFRMIDKCEVVLRTEHQDTNATDQEVI